jgi:hypothetical protein
MSERRPLVGLTLHRPWPWAICALPEGERKDVENRDWPAPAWLVGGYVAIHSGLKWDPDGWATIHQMGYDCPGDAGHPKAVITCVAKLAEVVTSYRCSRWRSGTRYAFRLEDVVRLLEPVPCRGGQKLWTVPAAIYCQVRGQWKRAREASGR